MCVCVCTTRRRDVLFRLLQAGADLAATDKHLETALHMASRQHNPDAVAFVISTLQPLGMRCRSHNENAAREQAMKSSREEQRTRDDYDDASMYEQVAAEQVQSLAQGLQDQLPAAGACNYLGQNALMVALEWQEEYAFPRSSGYIVERKKNLYTVVCLLLEAGIGVHPVDFTGELRTFGMRECHSYASVCVCPKGNISAYVCILCV